MILDKNGIRYVEIDYENYDRADTAPCSVD